MLSAFEEWGAACISDILRQVSNEQYLDAIRMAEKFILHVEVLFGNLKVYSVLIALYGPRLRLVHRHVSHSRSSYALPETSRPVYAFVAHTRGRLAADRQTQELLALVTGIAHYLKILIRIALTGALKLEKEQSVREAMASCLDKLHLLAVQSGDPGARQLIKNGSGEIMGQNGCMHGVTYGYRSLASELVGESPFSIMSPSRLSVNNPPCQMHVGSGGGLRLVFKSPVLGPQKDRRPNWTGPKKDRTAVAVQALW